MVLDRYSYVEKDPQIMKDSNIFDKKWQKHKQT